MGDFKPVKKNTTKESAQDRERRSMDQSGAVEYLLRGSKLKDKVISAKVYPETWASFTAINKAQGMSNNSVLNKLITEYVRDNSDWIE